MDPSNLIGSLKAAILVHALGWEVMAPVMNHLDQSERDLVFKMQSKLDSISPKLVESIAKEFLEKANALPPSDRSAGQNTQSTEGGPGDRRSGNLAVIQSIPPDSLIPLIQYEHPQTIALIIAHLLPHVASRVMAMLPDELRSDVALRIASLDKVSSEMLQEIDTVFEEILAQKDTSAAQRAGGVSYLAEILNMIEGTASEQIIEEIEENDPELAHSIRQNMFVFDDLVLVDDRGLQKVLRAVESHEMAVALKAATHEVKEKVFKNMSDRAAHILREEIEASGAVRIKAVTDAQGKIAALVQEMERKGELVISGRGGEAFVD